MTRKRIVSYVLAVIMLVSTCAVPVSTASASDSTTTTQDEIDQATALQNKWEASGRNNGTTLFIGDSYFSETYGAAFKTLYSGKDIQLAGISETTTDDWIYFLSQGTFLENTIPHQIVVHLGHQDIVENPQATGTEIAEKIQELLSNMHVTANLANTKIYFLGISYRNACKSTHVATVDDVNTAMETWCQSQGNWIIYAEPVQNVEGYGTDSYTTDSEHLSETGYAQIKTSLEAAKMVIRNVPQAAGDTGYKFQAMELQEEWNIYGNPKKTTLFIGDSIFSKKYWDTFADTYAEQDVILAGIDRTSSLEWKQIFTKYFADTKPKNLVVHLGTEDIHKDGSTGVQTSGYLKELLEQIHESDNFTNTHIYYFGIPECKDKGRTYDVDYSNTVMETWCAAADQKDWITYIAPIDIQEEQFLDEINLTAEGYQLIVNKIDDIIGIEPAVALDFNKGNVKDSVTPNNSNVGTYQLNGTGFVACTGTNDYTNGRNGDAGCAIVINHQKGTYPFVKSCDFQNDFVISTWFNVEDQTSLTDGAGNYLFGIAHPDDNTGFSACIKKDPTAGYQLRVKVQDTTGFYNFKVFNQDTWYHLTVWKEGTQAKWYLNGEEIQFDKDLPTMKGYANATLAFGAYSGKSNTFYKDANVYFDDVEVYYGYDSTNASVNAKIEAICEDRDIEDARDVTTVVGDANYDDAFTTADLIRLQRYLVTKAVDECSFDGDMNVSGKANDPDLERCKEMLVGDKVLHVNAMPKVPTRTSGTDQWNYDETTSYKLFQSTDNFYTYYEVKKGAKAGQTITFKILFGEGDYSAYAYYDGCGRWEPLGTTTTKELSCTLVAAEDIKSFYIKVVNNANNTVINNYTGGASFKVYDIRVSKAQVDVASRVELSMTYDGSQNAPVLYGMSETLDMTKFTVDASGANLSYEWKLMKDGVEKTLTATDMESTNYAFDEPGTYLLTAIEKTTNNGCRTSMNIYVFGPDVYVNYNKSTVENSGLAKSDTNVSVGTYVFKNSNNADEFDATTNQTITYIDGRSGKAIQTNHKSGPYTVVKGYDFGTGDFIISTWFNVPDADALGNNSNKYLFGNGSTEESDTEGFSVCIKENSSGQPELRIKVGTTIKYYPFTGFNENTWYHLAACRQGAEIEWYLNGKRILSDITFTAEDYGTRDLAFGAYPRVGKLTENERFYDDSYVYFDDIEVYGSNLSDAQVDKICRYAKPAVVVDYKDGTVTNTGTAENEVNACVLDGFETTTDNKQKATEFESADNVSYVAGINGDANGAIVTNHKSGPYTVVKKYNFEKNNFTISTWFKIPAGVTVPSNGSGVMLLGNDNPDTTTGFAICLQSSALRVKVAGETQNSLPISYNKDTWYNLTVSREGSAFKVYFDGDLKETYDIGADCNYGQRDLAFGAYHGVTWSYNDTNTYFDDIEVYDSALTADQIQRICSRYDAEPDVFVDFKGGTVANAGIYQNMLLGRYKFNNASATDYLTPATDAQYVDGVGNDSQGAASINHHDGAYTAAHDYRYGINDFTVSTWFKIPKNQVTKMGVSGTYLFGSTYADATDGFSVTIKYDEYQPERATESYSEHYLRMRLLGTTYFYAFDADPSVGHVEFVDDTWYHLTLCREGTSLKLYLNGQLILEDTMAASSDLGIENLNIGACPGFGHGYTVSDTYFDEVQLYHEAMTASEIKAMYESYNSN